MDGKLVFHAPADGTGRLVFGDTGEAVVPDATFIVDGELPGLGTLAFNVGTLVHIEADLPGLEGSIGVAWDANVSRSAQVPLRIDWQESKPIAAALEARWQETTSLRQCNIVRWQNGARVSAGLAVLWQDTIRLRSGTVAHWQDGNALRSSIDMRWQESDRLRSGLVSHWQEASTRRGTAGLLWQETLRLRSSFKSHWQDAAGARLAVLSHWTQARLVRTHLRSHWQEAIRPPSGVSLRPPVVPEPKPPCYDPATIGRLVFLDRFTGDGRLVFFCDRKGTGPDPEQPQFVIPLLRVYMAVHSISAYLLPSMERVQLKGINIASSDDGYCWTLSASGGEHLMEQLAPVNGLPARVLVSVDGIDWVFAISPPSRSRTFIERSVQVQGNSVSMLLGSGWMPEQTWSTTGDFTAQQLVAKALEFTGVAVDWQVSDWVVPAAAWSHQGTPLSVATRVAEAAGASLRSHRTDAVLQFVPKFQSLPWEWAAATPTVIMPGQILTKDTLQSVGGVRYNAVYVCGTVEGSVQGHIRRLGTQGDVLATQVTDPLITHELAAMQRGRTVLSEAAITKRQPITIPLLTGGTNPGVILPGYLLEVNEPGETWRGMVRSVSLSESAPVVEQTLIVDRAI